MARLISSPMQSPALNVATRGTGVYLGGRFSKEEVVAFGGIPEAAVFDVRTSERIRAQPNADKPQLERAQAYAQAKDDILYSGTRIPSKFTFASIPNDVVAARASKLGISLGSSASEVSKSIESIKDIDLNKTLIMLKNKKEALDKQDDNQNSFILRKANCLSSDLIEEENASLDGHLDPPHRPVKPIKINKRKVPQVDVVRRCSARLKNKQVNNNK